MTHRLTERERRLFAGTTETDMADDTTDSEEEDIADQFETSLSNLVGQADPQRFDQTFLVEKDDVPAATTEPFPIPQPWQGIPRIAVTVNLNYVYDEDRDEWVRDSGNFSSGSATDTQLVTLTVPDGGTANAQLDGLVIDQPIDLAARFDNFSNVPDGTQLQFGDPQNGPTPGTVGVYTQTDSQTGDYILEARNVNVGQAVDIEVLAYNVQT